MSTYTIKEGETITDVSLNATGTIGNWSLILEANGFTDWTPALVAGQSIIIPDGVEIQNNTLRELKIYPAANNPGISNLDEQISELIGKFTPPTIQFEDGEDYIFEDGNDYSFENG